VFGNPTIADAVLDRLVHTAHRIELKANHCANCAPPKPPDLTRRLAPEPNVAALRSYCHPGWLPSECLAGFNRNQWLTSSESMADFVGIRNQKRGRTRIDRSRSAECALNRMLAAGRPKSVRGKRVVA
jgi:hypothetical protein